MAKKKPKVAAKGSSSRAKGRPRLEGSSKSRFELRFDSEVYEGIRRLAEQSGISVNQLMQGLAGWAIKRGIPGESERDEDGFVKVRDQPGCVFFGKRGANWKPGEREEWEEAYGEDMGDYREQGEVIFTLDFTVRRVVRDEDD